MPRLGFNCMQPLTFIRRNFPKDRPEWILFAAGINLMLLNFILVQHFGVGYRNPELAVLSFSLAYFCGISLGYYVSDRIKPSTIRWIFPLALPIQLAILLFIQAGAYLIQQDANQFVLMHDLGRRPGWVLAYVLGFLVTSLFVTSIYAIFLPATIEANNKSDQGEDAQANENRGLRRFYSIEILGSIFGLALLPILASISHTILLAGYLLVFIGISVGIRVSRTGLLAIIAVSGIFLQGYHSWDQQLATWFYQHWYPNKGVYGIEYSRFTPYHKIEVIKIKNNRRMLALNGKRQFAHGGHFNYSYFLAEYPARLLGQPNVALLGCGVMSTVGRIGDLVPSITIVDIDPGVFETSRKYFQEYNRLDSLDNWQFIADDAKHFVANTDQSFELIMHDIPPAYSRQIALTYTAEFFTLVKQRLKPQGLFSIASLTPLSGRSDYGKHMLATLTHVFDNYFVLIKGSSVYFFGGGPDYRVPDKITLRAAIDHPSAHKVKIYTNQQIDRLVEGYDIITIDNIGELIFD